MQIYRIIYEVQQYVARDELDRAMYAIISVARRNNLDCLNEAIVLSRELSSLEKMIVRGAMKWEDEKMAKNQLAYRILKLASIVEDHTSMLPSSLLEEEDQAKKKKA